jgi:hypothetical protein
MPTEPEVYAQQLAWVLERAAELIESLDGPALHFRPSIDSANSAATIATHLAGATAAFALGMGAGLDVMRDRVQEFSEGANTTSPDLADSLRTLALAIKRWVGELSPENLEREFIPSKDLWGTGEPHSVTAREMLAESLRHAGIHLGELRLVHDLARAASKGNP